MVLRRKHLEIAAAGHSVNSPAMAAAQPHAVVALVPQCPGIATSVPHALAVQEVVVNQTLSNLHLVTLVLTP